MYPVDLLKFFYVIYVQCNMECVHIGQLISMIDFCSHHFPEYSSLARASSHFPAVINTYIRPLDDTKRVEFHEFIEWIKENVNEEMMEIAGREAEEQTKLIHSAREEKRKQEIRMKDEQQEEQKKAKTEETEEEEVGEEEKEGGEQVKEEKGEKRNSGGGVKRTNGQKRQMSTGNKRRKSNNPSPSGSSNNNTNDDTTAPSSPVVSPSPHESKSNFSLSPLPPLDPSPVNRSSALPPAAPSPSVPVSPTSSEAIRFASDLVDRVPAFLLDQESASLFESVFTERLKAALAVRVEIMNRQVKEWMQRYYALQTEHEQVKEENERLKERIAQYEDTGNPLEAPSSYSI